MARKPKKEPINPVSKQKKIPSSYVDADGSSTSQVSSNPGGVSTGNVPVSDIASTISKQNVSGKKQQNSTKSPIVKLQQSGQNFEYGDLYKDPQTGKLYSLLVSGNSASVRGQVMDIDTYERLPLSQVANIIQDSNKIKGKMTPNGYNKEALEAIRTRTAQRNTQGKHDIYVDFEAKIKPSVSDYKSSDIEELAIRSVKAEGPNQFGKKGVTSPVQDVTIFSKGVTHKNELAKAYRIVGNSIPRHEMRIALDENTFIDSKHVIKGSEIVERLGHIVSTKDNSTAMRTLYRHTKEMVERSLEAGADPLLIFESEQRGVVNTALERLSEARKNGSRVIAHNAQGYEKNLIHSLTGKRIEMADSMDVFRTTFGHIFPAANEGLLEQLNQYRYQLRDYHKENGIGQDVVERAINETEYILRKGFKDGSSAKSTQEYVYNLIYERIYKGGPGGGKIEMHRGAQDNIMNQMSMELLANDPLKFAQVAEEFYARDNLTLSEGLVRDVAKYMYADQMAQQDDSYHKNLKNGRYKAAHRIRDRYAKQFDKPTQQSNRVRLARRVNKKSFNQDVFHAVLHNSKFNKKSTGVNPFSKGMQQSLGTSGMSSILGSMVLGGSVQYLQEKMAYLKSKIGGAEQLEGMSHNSVMTLFRRLSMTQFGSGWRGFVSGVVREMSKSFLRNPSETATGIRRLFTRTNEVRKKLGVRALLEKKFWVRRIGDFHRLASNQLKNPGSKPTGWLLQKTGTFLRNNHDITSIRNTKQYAKDTWRSLKENSVANILGISREDVGRQTVATSLSTIWNSQKVQNLKPFFKMGGAAAVAINIAAKTHLGEMESKSNQKIQGLDPYQRDAFATGQHKLFGNTNAPTRETMFRRLRRSANEDTKDLREKGISRYTASLSTEFRRRTFTDYGSRRHAYNMTTQTYAMMSLSKGYTKAGWGIDGPQERTTYHAPSVSKQSMQYAREQIISNERELARSLQEQRMYVQMQAIEEQHIEPVHTKAMKVAMLETANLINPMKPNVMHISQTLRDDIHLSALSPDMRGETGQSMSNNILLDGDILEEMTTPRSIDWTEYAPRKYETPIGNRFAWPSYTASDLYNVVNSHRDSAATRAMDDMPLAEASVSGPGYSGFKNQSSIVNTVTDYKMEDARSRTKYASDMPVFSNPRMAEDPILAIAQRGADPRVINPNPMPRNMTPWRVPNTNERSRYDKIEAWNTDGQFRFPKTEVPILNNLEVSALTFEKTNESMYHNAEGSAQNNDHLYER